MENDNKLNSCLMLAANLITPVSLDSIFDSGDTLDIVVDSHITILFEKGKHLDFTRDGFTTSNDLYDLKEMLKIDKEEEELYSVFDLFELGKFENDVDYVVLRLKDNKWFNVLSKLNKELTSLYKVHSDFSDYKPHMSLAKLNSGCAGKYMNNQILNKVLQNSLVRFEDIVYSYDFENDTYKKFNVTNNFNVDRFFRERDLKKELE